VLETDATRHRADVARPDRLASPEVIRSYGSQPVSLDIELHLVPVGRPAADGYEVIILNS
jgi:hypothetical protein